MEIIQILNQELARLQERNPHYSLRAFSRRIGVQPSTLSRILTGKRAITRTTGKLILDNLCIEPALTLRIVSQLKGRNDARSGTSKKNEIEKNNTRHLLKYVELSSDQFHAISEWHHLAIYSLAEIPGFQMDATWVAKQLGLKKTVATQALSRLVRMNLLKQNTTGEWFSSGVPLTTTTDIADASIRKAHFQSLELARQSLERDAIDKRDFSHITMAINLKRLPEAKDRIRKFRRELCEFLESDGKEKVYRLNMQLFPVYGK